MMGYAYGNKWDESQIISEINRIVNLLKINHFPTHSEMFYATGSRALSNKISKSGGTKYWAKKINMPIKRCESEVGNDFELKALRDIKENTGFDGYQTKPRYPYDLVVSQNIRVDVKVSLPHTTRGGVTANSFNLEKNEPTCDIFMLYCLKKNGLVGKLLIIPACILKGKTQVGVGILSKWDWYENKWEYFHKFNEFNKDILNASVALKKRRSKVVEW